MAQLQPDFALYNYFRSSASHRVRIALHLKQIDFDYKPVHLLNNGGEQHTGEYTHLNPSHQVPTLIHRCFKNESQPRENKGRTEDRVIGQSMAILDYLDQIAPAPRLFPREPGERALCFQICEIINSGMQPLFNLKVLQELGARFQANQNSKNEWTQLWMNLGLAALEELLLKHAGPYCLGAEVTAADCF